MGNTVVISMNTSPPGNVTSQFVDNVLPRNTSILLPIPAQIPTVTPINEPIPQPPPPTQTQIQTRTIFATINVLHKIIDEVNKSKPNKYLIISYIKSVINNLVNTM